MRGPEGFHANFQKVFPGPPVERAGVPVDDRHAIMKTLEHCAKSAHAECLHETNEKCGRINCCIIGFMSRCGAGPLVIDQRACRFFKLSSGGERCMHYCVALDGHCDSVDAQQEMKNKARLRN